eukprot:gb/GECG01014769.1/.p1 GENE.gb/GECG01014769.1/~~gb/GECG01014769.1/.p1  ORF type:complete len:205 (+),score=39.00 gb/GECG01014769.1/:1-615(+)
MSKKEMSFFSLLIPADIRFQCHAGKFQDESGSSGGCKGCPLGMSSSGKTGATSASEGCMGGSFSLHDAATTLLPATAAPCCCFFIALLFWRRRKKKKKEEEELEDEEDEGVQRRRSRRQSAFGNHVVNPLAGGEAAQIEMHSTRERNNIGGADTGEARAKRDPYGDKKGFQPMSSRILAQDTAAEGKETAGSDGDVGSDETQGA